MSLTVCPDCGHEISTTATACQNCGRPFAKPIIERKIVVAETPREDSGIPMWVFAVLGILGVLVLFILFVFVGRNDDEANRNISVNVAGRRDSTSNTRDTSRSADSSTVTTIPSTSAPSSVTIPSTSAPSTVTVPPSSTTTVTTVPNEPANKGTVVIDAKIVGKTGSPQAVRNEKFYLLDKDLESILSEADIEPISGQSLTNSFGLAVMYPSRYSEFSSKALGAIKKHIKYDTLTDSGGKGQMKNIEPDSYYLFGVTKSGKGFAVWSSPVSIRNGENVLNLSPQALTEIQEEPQQ
ncbi:MAG: zinc ribbon domain-containing protein [Pyrinomonadaceae bacterium]|nr:zinc ribbon domain-containing protein [Pyrinomonadaceae bacterium]